MLAAPSGEGDGGQGDNGQRLPNTLTLRGLGFKA